MNEEELLQLLPVVAELTRRYTSGESSSVTYERANQLMEAAVYCVREYEKSAAAADVVCDSVAVKDKYKIGTELVLEKINDTKDLYNEIITNFESCGNENYYDTVVKAIPGFFQYYDDQFEPQNTIITCDYPTVISAFAAGDTGVDLVYSYLDYIKTEQSFLSRLPVNFAVELLSKYDSSYRKQYYNISTVILRHMLGCMMIGKNIGAPETEKDYSALFLQIQKRTVEELEEEGKALLKRLVEQFYDGNEKIYEYFAADVSDFAVQIKKVRSESYIKNVVTL